MGNKWTTELGQTFLNTLAMPAEIVTGQNLYDPTFTSKLGKGINYAQDLTAGASASLAPAALNMVAPGAGTALTAARGFTPDLGKGGPQLEGHNNNQSGFGTGQAFGSVAAPFMGDMMARDGGYVPQFPMGGYPQQEQQPHTMEQTGSNMSTFNLPSHEQGGGQIAPNVEIEKNEVVMNTGLGEIVLSDDPKFKNPKTGNTWAEDGKKWKVADDADDITKRTAHMALKKIETSQEALRQLKLEKKIKRKQASLQKDMLAAGMTLPDTQEQGPPQGPMDGVMRKGGYYTPQEAEAAGHKFQSHGNVYGSAAGNYGGSTTYREGGYSQPEEYRFGKYTNQNSLNLSGLGQNGFSYGIGGLGKMNQNQITQQGINSMGTGFTPNPNLINGLPQQQGFTPNPNLINVAQSPAFVPNAQAQWNPQAPNLSYNPGPQGPAYQTPNFGRNVNTQVLPGQNNPNSPFFNGTGPGPQANQRTANMPGIGLPTSGGFADEIFDPSQYEGPEYQKTSFDWKKAQNAANEAGKYAGIGYNLWKGQQDPDYFKNTRNPEYDKVSKLMAEREYNADPIVAAMHDKFNRGKRMIDVGSSSEAVRNANIQGLDLRRNDGIYNTYAKVQNANNALRGQEAGVLKGLGDTLSSQLNQEELYRLRTDAAKDAFTGQGMNDLSKVSQVNQQMGNQQETDETLKKLLINRYGKFKAMEFLDKNV